MTQSPPVSLLIPTFNSARTVTAAVQSCVDQTFKDIEILIYDEACRDKTREIINGFAARDPRIRVMTSDTNSGPLMAWRKLLHEARGRYCAFVFADDLLMPTYVEKLYGALQKHPSDLLATCNAWVDYLPDEDGSSNEPLPPYQPTTRRHPMHDFQDARVKGDVYALGIFAFVFPVSQMCSLFDTKVGREVFQFRVEPDCSVPCAPDAYHYRAWEFGVDWVAIAKVGVQDDDYVAHLVPMPLGFVRTDRFLKGLCRLFNENDHGWSGATPFLGESRADEGPWGKIRKTGLGLAVACGYVDFFGRGLWHGGEICRWSEARLRKVAEELSNADLDPLDLVHCAYIGDR